MGFIIGIWNIRVLGLPIDYKLTRCKGTVTIFQYGAGPNGVMRTLGKYMVGSGATFGYAIFPVF